MLVATKFISVTQIIDLLSTNIPFGTKLYNRNLIHVGEYVKHVQDNDLNYHTMSTPRFTEVPFNTNDYGVIIERPFPVEAITDTIIANK